MVDFPFQQPQNLTNRQNKTLALAGVFEAAQLTHMTAMTVFKTIGENSNFYFEQLIKASLNIRPTHNKSIQTLSFFNQVTDLSLGLKILEETIEQPISWQKTNKRKKPIIQLPMSYAMSLLQLEKKVYANPDFVKKIENMQTKLIQQLCFFDQNYLHPNLIANLAQTYVETAGTIHPRILIRGNSQAFKDSNHTNRIRAALFTGLQLAHLWRQLGGSSLQFIFGKRKLLQDVQKIAHLQSQLIEK